ncbi:hypothetical protein HJFPF1_12948 [Paramyrothecium foliicola]|nr:hypothetical protein HJFPF1_12948 [Paramyrothecium foliicola]
MCRSNEIGILEGVPAPFNKVNKWARHIMETAVSLVVVGCRIAIDEIIAGFKGRSRYKVTIKNKPTPTGLKIWALAAGGYLLWWLWHQPGPTYGPIGLLATTKARGNARPSQQSQRPDAPDVPDVPDDPDVPDIPNSPVPDDSDDSDHPDGLIYSSSSDDSADEGNGEKGLDIGAPFDPFDETASQPRADIIATLPPLNPTQAVVVTLVSQLPEGTYHVIINNLFSSPNLFRALRILGVGATGTCPKENDRKGRQLWPWGRLRSWPTPDNKG